MFYRIFETIKGDRALQIVVGAAFGLGLAIGLILG